MRAICYENYGGLDELAIVDTAVPKLSKDEVLVRVEAASLNPFDWKLRKGLLRDIFSMDFPVTPGRDGCGTIVQLGKSVSESTKDALAEGQRVSFISSRLQNGSLAGFAAVQASDFVVPAPQDLDPTEAAALPLVGLSAWNALVDTAKVKSGMRILIHGGSGGVGTIAIQLARHLGAEVYATCSKANVERVTTLGAEAIPYDEVDFIDAVSACDVVLDTVGGTAHEKSYEVLRPGGCLVYLLAAPFRDRSGEFDVNVRQAIVLNRTANLRHVLDLAAEGAIRPVIGQALPFDEFRKAFELGEAGRAGGKIVLNVAGSFP